MHGLLSLGPSGPFSHTSQPAWFFPGAGLLRYLDVAGYQRALTELGEPDYVTADMAKRLRAEGASRVLWATAHGGKSGHAHVHWDVRVIRSESPAAEAVARIAGVMAGQCPLGTTPVEQLKPLPEVLAAYCAPVEPTKVKLPSSAGPRWARRLGLPVHIRYHFTRAAYAAIAAGHIGATVTVYADSLPSAEHGLRSLVDVVLDDLRHEAVTS